MCVDKIQTTIWMDPKKHTALKIEAAKQRTTLTELVNRALNNEYGFEED